MKRHDIHGMREVSGIRAVHCHVVGEAHRARRVGRLVRLGEWGGWSDSESGEVGPTRRVGRLVRLGEWGGWSDGPSTQRFLCLSVFRKSSRREGEGEGEGGIGGLGGARRRGARRRGVRRGGTKEMEEGSTFHLLTPTGSPSTTWYKRHRNEAYSSGQSTIFESRMAGPHGEACKAAEQKSTARLQGIQAAQLGLRPEGRRVVIHRHRFSTIFSP